MSDNLYLKRVKLARKKFLELSIENEKELLRIYDEASKVILKEIRENKELDLETDYLDRLNKTLNQYANELNNSLGEHINNSTNESANIASEIQLAYIEAMAVDEPIKAMLNRVTISSYKKALEKIVRGNFYVDGKSLDNRIWDITQKNVKDIDTLIKVNISKGANGRKLAEQLETYINPKKRIEAKTLEAGMNSSISYQSQRLARTSISHAFSETCVENAKVNPFNKGLKWNLSPSHYERQVKKWGEDICDTHANQDGYGLGQGVFPADEFPFKHPNCLCYPTYVNAPIKDASREIKEWADGGKNDKLDKWYAKHNNGNKNNSKAYDELATTKQNSNKKTKPSKKDFTTKKDIPLTLDGAKTNYYIPKGENVKNIEVIAGKGVKRDIDDINRLIREYTKSNGDITDKNEWQKIKGFVNVTDGKTIQRLEVHWYECKDIGKVEWKIKAR